MGLTHSPKIVTNGLVLALDAANNKSYSGSGTTWYDLSGNDNTGTLTNGPTFNSTNGGSIVLDGTNDYINTSNSSSLQINQGTISAYIKTTDVSGNYHGILVKQSNYGMFVYGGSLAAYDWGNSSLRNSGVSISNGQWKHVTMTFTTNTGTPSNNAIFYINGISVYTFTIMFSLDTANLVLGMGGTPASPTQYFIGNIALAQVYNRPLSATEVLQNYNATKSRFGI